MVTWFYSFSGCTGTSAVGGGDLPSVLAETRCLFLSEAQLWSKEELCEGCVLRDKVPMMN